FIGDLFDLFQSNPEAYRSDTNKVITALSYIRGGQAEWWAEYIQEQSQLPDRYGIPRGYPRWNDFRKFFLDAFGIEDEINQAMTRLTTIKYEEYKNVLEFNIEMARLFVTTNILEDSAQIAFYRAKLPGYIRDKIALSYPLPTTMEGWAKRAIELD
ncbi:hypothetical protein C8Q76DRAFT_589222, partial [Earliella scabrosa]